MPTTTPDQNPHNYTHFVCWRVPATGRLRGMGYSSWSAALKGLHFTLKQGNHGLHEVGMLPADEFLAHPDREDPEA